MINEQLARHLEKTEKVDKIEKTDINDNTEKLENSALKDKINI